jgi:hypothetical protein
MKKLLFALCALFVATISVAQSGRSCEDAIVLTKDYQATITEPCELWYTANTYDLPIHVYFSPVSNNSAFGPDVEMDLTCIPGVYDDPTIDSLVNMVSDFSIEFPIRPTIELNTSKGRNDWEISVNKSYREQLAEFGVLYPVRAYVKVRFYEAGTISLSPDTVFSSCMDGAQVVNLGDTVDVLANDEQSVFVFPYSAWKNDSIRFVWVGDGQANVYVAEQECEFTPTSSYVFDSFTISSDAPRKLYSSQMKNFINNYAGGGIFYAKVVAPSAGKLVVEKIPMAKPVDGAEMLTYNQTTEVKSGDQLYCFPRTWGATEITAPQGTKIQMLVSASEKLTASATDANVIAVRDFVLVDGKRTLQFSSAEMTDIIAQATSDYLYVRFLVDAPMQITPTEWVTSSCLDKSYLITPNTEFAVAAKSSSKIFRARYADFANYDITIKWTGNSTLPTYIAETCEFSLSNTNPALLINGFSISRKGTKVIDAATVDAWEPRIPEEGFFFVRFNPNNKGNVTFVTEKPEEIVPVIPTSPCVINSIELKAGDQITLNLDSAFTVYRINYSQWVATGVTLTWTGVEPLHTFVAETCEFAVAPYNKYVHAYVSVPTEGAAVLDAAKLAEMAAYVDEDGYLYIRFLTEKEGVLEVK